MNTRSAASRRRIPDDLAVKMTLSRFASHPPRSLEDLAAEFGRDTAVISRSITRAFRDGLVVVRPAVVSGRPARREELERELLARYEQLETCAVIEAGQPRDAGEDDRLHSDVAAAMAGLIGSGAVFRAGDVVGVGSGRAVFYVAKHLSAYPPLRASVTMVALTGHVHPRDHSEQVNFLLDADVHLGLLGLCFSRSVTLHPVGQALICRTPDEARRDLAAGPLSPAAWQKRPATHGLLGIGVLAEGHRFYKLVKADPQRQDRLFSSIRGHLDALVRVCDQVARDYGRSYCPIADVANRLFYAPPPPSLGPRGLAETLERRVRGPIEEINSRLVTLTEAQLRSIGALMLVAASRGKAAAVRKLLKERYPVRVLCVDQSLAADLLV